jgi:hypothetical protein
MFPIPLVIFRSGCEYMAAFSAARTGNIYIKIRRPEVIMMSDISIGAEKEKDCNGNQVPKFALANRETLCR